jgi:prostaglandin reductase 1
MVKARKWILLKHFEGLPKRSDLDLQEEELPPLKDGEFLAEAVYLSVDPYMRGFSKSMKPGDVMIGEQVARIVESKNANFSAGDFITARFGWRSHTIADGTNKLQAARKIDATLSQPKSTAIGILGMPGLVIVCCGVIRMSIFIISFRDVVSSLAWMPFYTE